MRKLVVLWASLLSALLSLPGVSLARPYPGGNQPGQIIRRVLGNTVTWEYHYDRDRESACKFDGVTLSVRNGAGKVTFQREHEGTVALYPSRSSYQVYHQSGGVRRVKFVLIPTLRVNKCAGSSTGVASIWRALVVGEDRAFYLTDRISTDYSGARKLKLARVFGQDLNRNAWARREVGELVLVYREELPLNRYPEFGYIGRQLHRYRLLRLESDSVAEIEPDRFEQYRDEIDQMLTSVELNRTLPELSDFEKFFNRAYQRYCYHTGEESYETWYRDRVSGLVGYDQPTFERAESWLKLIESQDCKRLEFSLD